MVGADAGRRELALHPQGALATLDQRLRAWERPARVAALVAETALIALAVAVA